MKKLIDGLYTNDLLKIVTIYPSNLTTLPKVELASWRAIVQLEYPEILFMNASCETNFR